MTRTGWKKRSAWIAMGFLTMALTGVRPTAADPNSQPPEARSAAAQAEPGEEATPSGPTTEELEERIEVLERRQEVEEEKKADTSKAGGSVTAGRDGISIRSADGAYVLRFRGYVQADARFFTDDQDHPAINTFVIRRARPILEGTLANRFDFKIMPDFGLGTTVLQEAYMDWRLGGTARLRAGKCKAPFGLERLQSALDILFVERGLPTNIAPNRDIGMMLWGEPAEALVSYAAGIFNGVVDGGSADADNGNGKDGVARVFVQPFLRTSSFVWRGFGIGVAASDGDNTGVPATPALPTYRTPGQQTFFSYLTNTPATAAGTVVADGHRERLEPQLYWSIGRFGLMAEDATSRQDVVLGTNSATLENEAWEVTASFLVTTDATSFKGVTPKKPLDPKAHQWGAWEIVARAGAQRQDKDSFPIYADPAASAEVARDRGIGMNWYPSRNAKLMLDVIETRFQGGAAAGADRETERVILNRLQISF
jgi:phosphate-selective porin OprO/OprP